MKSNFKLISAIVVSVMGAGSLFGQSPKLNDPEIASVAVVANQIDVNFAKIAKGKSKNTEVLNFAETMLRDHQSAIDQATALVKKLGVTPMDNSVSKMLNSDADAMMKTLRSKEGAAFNKAYIKHEVDYHKAVLNEIENQLIPQTQNAELKDLLIKILPVVRTHLSHAEMLQKSNTE